MLIFAVFFWHQASSAQTSLTSLTFSKFTFSKGERNGLHNNNTEDLKTKFSVAAIESINVCVLESILMHKAKFSALKERYQ